MALKAFLGPLSTKLSLANVTFAGGVDAVGRRLMAAFDFDFL